MFLRALLILFCTGSLGHIALAQTLVQRAPKLTGCAAKTLSPSASTRASGTFADANIHVTFYRLELKLNPSPALLRGVVSSLVVSRSDSLGQVMFDLSGSMTVDSALVSGKRTSLQQYPEGIVITLDRTYRKGEVVEIAVVYHGLPDPTGFGSFVFSTDSGSPWIWSLSEPYGARDWWPCKDDNADKADSVDVWVTVPSGLKVGSNGRLLQILGNGDGTETHKWAERYPIAAYLVSLAVSNYAQWTDYFRYTPSDSMVILNYVLPEHLDSALTVLKEVKDMLRIFSGLYGLYPFSAEKYGHSEFGRGGAMEHQTMTSTTNFIENTISHELAHQWFGDMITCANWPSLWLNEGFAVYSECLFLERYRGEAAFLAHLGDYYFTALQATGSLYVQDTTTVANLFDPNRVYSKGAWTLHMLRHVLGDTLFFQSMRAYAADPRFRYKSATTEGFRSVCEAVSGEDLEYFFDEWVYGEGYPQYVYSWSAAAASPGYDLHVRVTQKGSTLATPFFRMPLDVRISGTGRDTTVVFMNTSSDQTGIWRIPFAPTSVTLDPDRWVLRDIMSADAVLPTSYSLQQNYPNPFNPTTTISFSLPHRSSVTLTVFDALGRKVATLVQGVVEAGSHSVSWGAKDDAGRPVGSGIYYYRLIANTFQGTEKMVLVR